MLSSAPALVLLRKTVNQCVKFQCSQTSLPSGKPNRKRKLQPNWRQQQQRGRGAEQPQQNPKIEKAKTQTPIATNFYFMTNSPPRVQPSLYTHRIQNMYVCVYCRKRGKKTFVCTVFAALTAWLSSRYAFNFLVRSVYKSHNRKRKQKIEQELYRFVCNIYMEIEADFALTTGSSI